jgi:hypothetical protein
MGLFLLFLAFGAKGEVNEHVAYSLADYFPIYISNLKLYYVEKQLQPGRIEDRDISHVEGQLVPHVIHLRGWG